MKPLILIVKDYTSFAVVSSRHVSSIMSIELQYSEPVTEWQVLSNSGFTSVCSFGFSDILTNIGYFITLLPFESASTHER